MQTWNVNKTRALIQELTVMTSHPVYTLCNDVKSSPYLTSDASRLVCILLWADVTFRQHFELASRLNFTLRWRHAWPTYYFETTSRLVRIFSRAVWDPGMCWSPERVQDADRCWDALWRSWDLKQQREWTSLTFHEHSSASCLMRWDYLGACGDAVELLPWSMWCEHGSWVFILEHVVMAYWKRAVTICCMSVPGYVLKVPWSMVLPGTLPI